MDPGTGVDDMENRNFLTPLELELWPLDCQLVPSCYTNCATVALCQKSLCIPNFFVLSTCSVICNVDFTLVTMLGYLYDSLCS
jgi:hypothetical protein